MKLDMPKEFGTKGKDKTLRIRIRDDQGKSEKREMDDAIITSAPAGDALTLLHYTLHYSQLLTFTHNTHSLVLYTSTLLSSPLPQIRTPSANH